jgi:hypothetical protein
MAAPATQKSKQSEREAVRAMFEALRALSRIEYPSRVVQDAMRALHNELSLYGYSVLVNPETGRRTLASSNHRAQRRA